MKYVWEGCSEDCFNCEYYDCLRPANKCKSVPYTEKRRGKNIDKLFKEHCEQQNAIDDAIREIRM